MLTEAQRLPTNNWASDGINLSDITDNVIKMEEPSPSWEMRLIRI